MANSEKKTTILHVVSALNVGGMETQLLSLLRHSAKDKYRPVVVCIREGGTIAREISNLGVKVVTLNRDKGLFDPLLYYKLKNIIEKEKADIIHCHGFVAGVKGQISSFPARTPVLIKSYHGQNLWKKWHLLLLDQFISKFTDMHIVVSNYRKATLLERERIRESKVVTVHNGIEYKEFDRVIDRVRKKKELGLHSAMKCVGTVGSLTKVKNHKLLFQAAKRILKQNDGVEFVIVGGGLMKDELMRQCYDLKIQDHVKFLGMRRDIPEILQVMDVFVMFSMREDLSIAIMEAMSAKLPVIGTKTGGNQELIVNDKTGFVVGLNNPDQMAEKITYLLANEQEAIRMGEYGRDRIERHFGADRNARKIQGIYETCLARKACKR